MVESSLKRIVSLLCLCIAAASSCGTFRGASDSADVTSEMSSSPAIEVSASESVTKGSASMKSENIKGSRVQFALNLFDACSSLQKDKASNLVVSPFSAGTALSMLMEGSTGQTRQEIENALCGSTFAGANLLGDEFVTVESANSIWIQNTFSVKKSFEDILKGTYSAEINPRNFRDPKTVSEINAWCSEHTAGKIPSIVDKIGPDMVLFILNALYFNAPWMNKFDKNATTKMTFHSAGSDNQIDFMRAEKEYAYAEFQGNQIIRIPYEGGIYSMIVALPAETSSVEQLMSSVTAEAVEHLGSYLSRRKVSLSLPKFRIEQTLVLNDVLKAMGIARAFSNAAELDAMVSAPVAVDEVKQKTYIDVSEQGTEAAAVTSIGVRLTSVRPDADRPVRMTVDRPFVFFIQNQQTSDILFAGAISTLK